MCTIPGCRRHYKFEVCDPETGWCATPEVWEELNPRFWQERKRDRGHVVDGPNLDGPGEFPLKPFKVPKTWEEGKKEGYSDEELQNFVDLGFTQPPNLWLMDVSRRSTADKFMGALRITEVYLPQHIKQQFRQLFSAQNVAITTGVIGLWAGSHYVGIGLVVDALLLGAAAFMTGMQLSEAASDLYSFFDKAAGARTVADLHAASEHMARFVATVGIDVFIGLITRRARIQPPRSRPIPVFNDKLLNLHGRRIIHNVASDTGIAAPGVWKLRTIAMRHGVAIRVRPARKGHGRLRTLGYSAKPEWAKMKTVDPQLDPLIGGPTRDGVAYFKPKMPDPSLKAKDPQLYQRAMNQYHKRMGEWNNLDLRADLEIRKSNGEISVFDDGLIIDNSSGKPFAGDYDIFEILDSSGRRLKPGDALYEAVLRDLERGSIRIQHPDHMSWTPKNAWGEQIKIDIIKNHAYKEPLVEFRWDGSGWRTLADPLPGDGIPLGLAFGRGENWFE